ncbi:hypothetical protein IV203_029903 [Nitzschia inconspicua]|uniref:Uncharacterized protein n=1 Tax=Nitzschia inconspicua TaxID=303405 RepID=A0A9K3LS68_9STRA|nr:hypothetical protein IV203_029903 [Nitzschia inconspicua]
MEAQDELEEYVDEYQKYYQLRELYSKNIEPVWKHEVSPDNTTLPPNVAEKRMAGRPKTVRLRKSSHYSHEPEKSPMTCSRCHQRGHNNMRASELVGLVINISKIHVLTDQYSRVSNTISKECILCIVKAEEQYPDWNRKKMRQEQILTQSRWGCPQCNKGKGVPVCNDCWDGFDHQKYML